MIFVVIADKLSQKVKDRISLRVAGELIAQFGEHISFIKMDQADSAAKALEVLALSPEESEGFSIILPKDWAGHGTEEFRDKLAGWGAEAAKKGKEKNQGEDETTQDRSA